MTLYHTTPLKVWLEGASITHFFSFACPNYNPVAYLGGEIKPCPLSPKNQFWSYGKIRKHGLIGPSCVSTSDQRKFAPLNFNYVIVTTSISCSAGMVPEFTTLKWVKSMGLKPQASLRGTFQRMPINGCSWTLQSRRPRRHVGEPRQLEAAVWHPWVTTKRKESQGYSCHVMLS